jgi:hypothetical protein
VDDNPRLTDIVDTYHSEAKRHLEALISSMRTLTVGDPEQEVDGDALFVVDAVVSVVRAARPDDPVVKATADLLSPERIARDEPMRAAMVLVVAEQLNAALGPSPSVIN